MHRVLREVVSRVVMVAVALLVCGAVAAADQGRGTLSPDAGVGSATLALTEIVDTAPSPDPMRGVPKENGLDFIGTWWFDQVASNQMRLVVEEIRNSRSSGTSGSLRLMLRATETRPVWGETISGYDLIDYSLGTLQSGFSFYGVDITQTVTWPPTGCYYFVLMLLEYIDGYWYYQEFAIAINSQTDGELFSVGGATCDLVSSCLENLSQGVVCMWGDQFEVTLDWTDFSKTVRPVELQRLNDVTILGTFQGAPRDVTVVNKITNGCSNNGYWWIWLGGFTKAGVSMTVRDTTSGTTVTYTKEVGNLMSTMKDQTHFPCD